LRILGDISDIASVSRLDPNENFSVFTTEHFFNGLLSQRADDTPRTELEQHYFLKLTTSQQ
jgi:hypothetical protein